MKTSRVVLFALILTLSLSHPPVSQAEADSDQDQDAYDIKVLVVNYFPLNGDRIDIQVTGDWGATLAETRAKTQRQTQEIIDALETGSTYHGYKNRKAKPSLHYKVVGTRTIYAPMPTYTRTDYGVPMTDYAHIMLQVNARDWLLNHGVREIWIWGYDGGKLKLWESNMSSPFGDVSNSDRDPRDLPVFQNTYTVYHYNYQRGTSEAVEDHMHQIEAILNNVDGRDTTPPENWPNLLFWGHFVGSDSSMHIVKPGCGWSHYPPNAEHDYDWSNPRVVLSDIEDWKPDGTGLKKPVSCAKWGCDSLTWFVYWMQSIPGAQNRLTYEHQKLRNWWVFIGDYDQARRKDYQLVK